MDDKPPSDKKWRILDRMGQKDAGAPQNNDSMRKPQQTSGTPAETYTKEMNMATDTKNKEQAEIYERFCTNVANESRPFNQRKTRPKWIEKDQYPGADFDICNPYGTESNAQAPYQGNNQTPYEGGGNNQSRVRPEWIERDQYPGADFNICDPYGTESNAQAPFKSNQAPFQGNQVPYGGDGGEARAQAGTSSQAKELFPRERERDSENSQPRNDRSRSPPAQRGRSLADRISFPKKENTILHTVVDSPRLGQPFGGKYKMTEQEQEDLQLYGKEVFERNRFADNSQCGNCGHFCHWLSDCAFPDDQGTIMDCPLCNTKLHFWDQCQRKKMLTTKQQLQLLLVRRRRKPMIRTTTSLRELLAEALQVGLGSMLNHSSLPWTQGFTMMLVKKRRDQPWLKYGPDELAEFPIDPETTGNVEDVMNTSVAGNEHHVRRAEL